MTRSFPSLSRVGGMLRGLTSSVDADHGAAGGEADVPEWVVAQRGPGRPGASGAPAERPLALPPRLGVFC
ncbi:hypothetical protein I6A84_41590 [Frankia sp. CNm7]|uniref:Uncharacterized protein n=1 Tax=Frankia nepalensis TaxID=1836974 RepID=A0A937RKK2_9ACTN|nr:hypothetical protein [Frankia nepalensis]MBL7499447.1 hypothetical protein [Frankia nepalensis]MBL7511862.1 hypothetical protein [Frankia nepalensis]MBL7524362.1 hypothetical protein [Frankia nepalensis]MBL7629034.1 hypothetical protein [Frankia nepalensis]